MEGEDTVRARGVLVEGVFGYDTISLTLERGRGRERGREREGGRKKGREGEREGEWRSESTCVLGVSVQPHCINDTL